jgi:hypothetical protein
MPDNDAERLQRTERYRDQLVKALEQYRPYAAPFSRPDPKHLVGLLFGFLFESCGEEAARHWFTEQGRSKEPRKKQEINNDLLLQLHDMEREVLGDAFSIMTFVSDRAKTNKNLPRTEQRGAGGTNSTALYHHLNDLLKKREAKRKQAVELLLRDLRERIDIWRRKLAEVSAAFAIARRKVFQNSKPHNNLS